MNTYTAKDQKEFDEIIKKILAKDKGAYIFTDNKEEFPINIQTNIKIKHDDDLHS